MTRKEVIAMSLDKPLVAKLKKLSNGNLSEYVNCLLIEVVGIKEPSLTERVKKLEDVLRAQGVEL